MKELAKKEYWNSVYSKMDSRGGNNLSFLKNWIKFQTRDYSNFLFWEDLFLKHLPKIESLKILEVGCAPGKYLINFKKMLHYDPYGVEYSKEGCEIIKNNFKKNNLNIKNIICADFFDDKFQLKNKEKFDIVFSRGFVEHYDLVNEVIQKHLDLIKHGGYVVISIPNLSGLNKFLAKFFNIDSFKLHNTTIMDKTVFLNLFKKNGIQEIYCDYVGIFSFGLFNTNKKWKYFLYRILLLVQRPFDFLLRVCIRRNCLKNRYSSPYLLFIGIKN